MDVAADVALLQSDDLQIQRVDDGALLVDMHSGRCFELNRTGVEIWNLIAGGATIRSLCTELARRYNISDDMIAADVNAIVASLMRQKLVRLASPQEPP